MDRVSSRTLPLLFVLMPFFSCGGDGSSDEDAVCGDGRLSSSEACDDGNRSEGDGCSAECRVERGFVCTSGGCRTSCGDGVIAGIEACDDGNRSSGDGCSADCVIEPIVGRLMPVTNTNPGALVTSATVGINVPAGTLVTASTLSRFDEQILVDGRERGPVARVTQGSQVSLRMSAPPGFDETRQTALLVEGVRLEWSVSTRTSTYGWQTGPYGPCSNPCGSGLRTRMVVCVDEQGQTVDDGLCPAPAPANVEECTDDSGCNYAYGAWSPWSPCMNGLRQRSRECRREDGALVECARCGGDCTGEGPCNVNCASLSGSIAYCAPRLPGDKMECDRLLQSVIDRCRASGCAPTPSSPIECTIGGNPGARQCYGGRITCE